MNPFGTQFYDMVLSGDGALSDPDEDFHPEDEILGHLLQCPNPTPRRLSTFSKCEVKTHTLRKSIKPTFTLRLNYDCGSVSDLRIMQDLKVCKEIYCESLWGISLCGRTKWTLKRNCPHFLFTCHRYYNL